MTDFHNAYAKVEIWRPEHKKPSSKLFETWQAMEKEILVVKAHPAMRGATIKRFRKDDGEWKRTQRPDEVIMGRENEMIEGWKVLEDYCKSDEPLQWVINDICEAIMEEAGNA